MSFKRVPIWNVTFRRTGVNGNPVTHLLAAESFEDALAAGTELTVAGPSFLLKNRTVIGVLAARK